jgi:hypothetical protein
MLISQPVSPAERPGVELLLVDHLFELSLPDSSSEFGTLQQLQEGQGVGINDELRVRREFPAVQQIVQVRNEILVFQIPVLGQVKQVVGGSEGVHKLELCLKSSL